MPVSPIGRQNFQELRIQRISRNFGAAVALAGLDLTIRSGEFIALLGPSGCGKINCPQLPSGAAVVDQRKYLAR
jgi:putative spermidine/putrescine transport system ATP-binding protein